MKMKLKVTHWEVSHEYVTSGFSEMESPVFVDYSSEGKPEKSMP